MMQFKHLFENENLARMMCGHWNLGGGQEPEIHFFRSSANAVYTVDVGDARFFLRITPETEKPAAQIMAETEFLRYLETQGYPCVKPVQAMNGEAVIAADTPWGVYAAVLFEKARGKRLDRVDYADGVYRRYGQSLGRLHRLSQGYRAPGRPSWSDRLDWCEATLAACAAAPEALKEVRLLRECLGALPLSDETYGLIHYDFELDNVFYDAASDLCTPIDFDDAMVFWYAADVEQALDSIREELPEQHRVQATACFLEGYQTERPLDPEMAAWMPAFRRFVNLYGYARCLRATHEKWDCEPEWMTGLRETIGGIMQEKHAGFGLPIDMK